jgi:heptosyltransferase II
VAGAGGLTRDVLSRRHGDRTCSDSLALPGKVTAPGEKLLVVAPSWVGDTVIAQTLFIHLYHTRPQVAIDVLAPAASEPLLARMPEVRCTITQPLGHGELGIGRRRQLGRELREAGYDQAIVLPNSLKSALAPWFAGIPRRTGWRGEMRYGLLNDVRSLDASALPQMAQRFLALGLPAGERLPTRLPRPRLRADIENGLSLVQSLGLAVDLPLLALCPGAEFGTAKRWPGEYYAQVALDFLARGWQVALFGSGGERALCDSIRASTGSRGGAVAQCHNLAGRTTLADAVDLLARATAVISNDSGLMHIAAALQRPVLAIYGPTSAAFTPPLGDRAAVLVPDLACAPCKARECPLGHQRCMRDTTPAQVSARLGELLAAAGVVL